MKKLTKKIKNVKVEITFAESKEYDTVKGILAENDITETPVKRPLPEIEKELAKKKKMREKGGDKLSEKKNMPAKKRRGGSSGQKIKGGI